MTNTQAVTVSMEQQIAALVAENAMLKQKAIKPTGGFKITPKGGLSVYGLGRFPVTLYKSQWIKLLSQVEQLNEFIAANADKLTDKA